MCLHISKNISYDIVERRVKRLQIRDAAGSFAATRELARRIGEVEFNALYHQGNGSHMFMNSVDEDTIMITVFGSRTTVGLVRFYSAVAATNVANLLKTLQRGGHGLQFTSADILAKPIFDDPPAVAADAPAVTGGTPSVAH